MGGSGREEQGVAGRSREEQGAAGSAGSSREPTGVHSVKFEATIT